MSALFDLFLAEYRPPDKFRRSLAKHLTVAVETRNKAPVHAVDFVACQDASLDEQIGKGISESEAEVAGLTAARDGARHSD
jgi:hypothetical protein